MNYVEALKTTLKTIERFNLKPIRLEIGKRKKFEGRECPATNRDPYLSRDGILVTDPAKLACHYHTWIFVKCEPKYVDYLANHFFGKNFIIYGETCGDDFRVMGKLNTKKTYKNPKATIINL